MGVLQSLIDKIPGYRHSVSFDERQSLVLLWADAVTLLSSDLDEIKEKVVVHFSERELVELTASIALMNTLNRLRIVLGEKF